MPTLDWIGKQAVVNHHREVPYRLVHCDRGLSAGDPESRNLLVQGDNLEALRALLPYYAGRVKCIYIDPPYNTGNEGWIYNDNTNSPEIRKWLGKVVGKKLMVENAGRMADSIVDDAFGRVAEAAKGLGGGSGIGGFFGKVLGGLFGGGGVPGFAGGGDFEVGGRGGIDRNVAVMRLSRGERVSIDRAGDRRGAGHVTVNISTPNPAAFERSRGQVAATISRAISRGTRNL